MIRSFLLHRTCAHRGMIVCDHKSCDRLSEWTGIWPGAGPHMCSGFHQKDITSPPSLPPRLQHSPVIGLSVCTLVGQLPRHTLYIYSCSFQTPGYGRSFWKLVKELMRGQWMWCCYTVFGLQIHITTIGLSPKVVHNRHDRLWCRKFTIKVTCGVLSPEID